MTSGTEHGGDTNPANPDPRQDIKPDPGHDAHGGDIVPPNDDRAGQRQSPQSGTPVRHQKRD